MANLIITVISIALVAVAALMGAYYGADIFNNGQYKSQANAWISQNKQIMGAANLYMADNGPSTNIPMCALIGKNYLQSWPNFINGPPGFTYYVPSLQQGGIQESCYSSGNTATYAQRIFETYAGKLVIQTLFLNYAICGGAFPAPIWTSAAYASHPAVLFAVAVNKAFNIVSDTYANSGLPNLPTGGSAPIATFQSGDCNLPDYSPAAFRGGGYIPVDANNNVLSGCYVLGGNQLVCTQAF